MNFEPFPYLKTERLLLRKLEFEDQNMIKILRSHPEVNRYIKRDPPSIDEAIQFIERIHSGLREGISVLWVISDKQSEQFMGTLCLWNFSEDGKTGEVGYDLLPEFHAHLSTFVRTLSIHSCCQSSLELGIVLKGRLTLK